jgi:DNA-binding LacI/PurR family transcriptional regulator
VTIPVLPPSGWKVPLSSVNQESEIMGERAAQMVLDLVGHDGKCEPREVRLRPTLVERASTLGSNRTAPVVGE